MRPFLVFVASLFLQLVGSSFGTCPPRPDQGVVSEEHKNSKLFYIDDENGNDSWSGTLASPNGNDDGPFKTFQGAVSGIRKQRDSTLEKATLFVRKGTYFLSTPVTLDSRDASLSIVGYPGDKRPLITGATKIPGAEFLPYDQTRYATFFNGICSKHVFLGENRLVRARKPNLQSWTGRDLTGEGPYLTIKDLFVSTPDCNRQGSGGFSQSCPDQNKLGFVYEEGDIDENWQDPTTGEILVYQAWVAERGHIGHIGNSQVDFSEPLRYAIGSHPKPSGWRYVVENIFEELDAVGEYFCDERNGLFFIYPPEGALDTDDVFVGTLETFFRVRNTNDIRFSDLEFRHSHDGDFAGYNERPAILDFENTDGIRVDRCYFANVAYTAVYFLSCLNVNIFANNFLDIGYFAVSSDYRNDPNDPYANRNIFIRKNTFEGCGVSNMLQPACLHVRGVGNLHVSGNEISRTPYAGMRIGWQLTFSLDYIANEEYIFYIERNHVHDFGLGILSDFAGIYLSSNPGCGKANADLTVCYLHAYVSKNVVHAGESYNYGAIGVYGDTAVSRLTVERNWLYDLDEAAVNFHCGQQNVALNNMIYHVADTRVFGVCNSIVGEGQAVQQILTFKKNVVFVNNAEARLYRNSDFWEYDMPVLDENIYFFNSTDERQTNEFFPMGISFNEWQESSGNDINSYIIQPRFRNVKSQDFRLRCTSTAFELGIKSVDLRYIRSSSGICRKN
ncbi:uncharacterized protein LOC143469097 [Clavelina lepadiformis]|uniref:Right handed beta helix domain-containing protein n=1 Tax=Clavelina lepadiformis TaxID=159417 RepID=A0ABP0F9U6_CLALP